MPKTKLRKKSVARRMEEERHKRREGMARAEGSAAKWFKEMVLEIIEELADSGKEFNSDEVRHELLRRDVEIWWPNSMGPLFASAARYGWIVKTGNFRNTDIERGHQRAYALWIGVN